MESLIAPLEMRRAREAREMCGQAPCGVTLRWFCVLGSPGAKSTPEELTKVTELLDIPTVGLQVDFGDHKWPVFGRSRPPTPSSIACMRYSVLVYDHSIKAIIREKVHPSPSLKYMFMDSQTRAYIPGVS
ncbi:hypothetical protein B0H19DRAFT_1254081 [Mycena capillaripes]|nr:hypothetical protein B0H19DRAFT_1254081 [Mycena capillaripes]